METQMQHRRTVQQLLADLIRYDDSPAVTDDRVALSYEQIVNAANELAVALTALGLRPGMRMAFAFGNSVEILRCYMACAAGGFVGVPLAERLTAAELEYQLRDSGATVVICGRGAPPQVVDVAEALGMLALHLETGELARAVRASSGCRPRYEAAPDDPFCVMYTGGTTGLSKAALQTHESWSCSLESAREAWSLTESDRHLVVLPMTHVAWFTVGAILCGGGSVRISERWRPDWTLNTVETEKITTLNMIPTMLGDLIAAQEENPRAVDSLRLITVAGSPIPAEMHRRALDCFGDIIGNIYGMTESSGPVTYLLPKDMRGSRISSAGRPGRYVEIEIIDEQDLVLPGGQHGEVTLAGPQMTAGYLNRDEETTEAFSDGRFRSGDIGYIDDDGYLFIVDRKKDMIKSGGFNIFPKEVEEVLYRHPDVVEAAVIGVRDPRWMEAVQAVVVVRNGRPGIEQELLDFCRGELAGYKVPKAIHLSRALPRTSIGKFDKKALRHAIQVS